MGIPIEDSLIAKAKLLEHSHATHAGDLSLCAPPLSVCRLQAAVLIILNVVEGQHPCTVNDDHAAGIAFCTNLTRWQQQL